MFAIIIMAARQLCWPPAIVLLLSFISFFSLHNLRGRGPLADRHQTLPHVRWRPIFIKFRQEFGAPSARNFAAQKHAISARFRTTSRLDREYLRNATRYHQSENGLQTTDTPAQANVIWCTLVHKRLKI